MTQRTEVASMIAPALLGGLMLAATGPSARGEIASVPADPRLNMTQTLPIRIEHVQGSGAVDPVLLAAWQAFRNGDIDTALRHYSEVLRSDAQNHNPPNRDALLGMATIARQNSQDAVAAEYYNEMLALDPRDPDAHAGMSSLPGASEAAETESRLKLVLAQRPGAVALHFALGNHYAEQSRWGEARQSYANALGLEPGDARFAFNLAVSLDHLGQRESAAHYYRHSLQLGGTGSAGFDRARIQLRLDELGQGATP